MKSVILRDGPAVTGRTPHGVRGLKSHAAFRVDDLVESHPSRGAWIEILVFWRSHHVTKVAPLTGCVD